MRTNICILALGVTVSCSASNPPAQADATESGHSVLVAPGDGNRIVVCDLPELPITVKVDSASAALSHFAMGTAELTGPNAGTHSNFDELIFVYGGGGMIFVEGDTLPAEPGTTMYVRRGDRHGFASGPGEPLRFAWVIVPPTLPRSFRESGLSSLDQCPDGLQ